MLIIRTLHIMLKILVLFKFSHLIVIQHLINYFRIFINLSDKLHRAEYQYFTMNIFSQLKTWI